MKHFSYLFLLSVLFVSGCATTQPHYYWGDYEGLVYKMYNKPGEAEPSVQVDVLTQDIQKANDAGKPVPPGVHAHLGFAYAAQGNVELAMAAFAQERALYPESKVLMDKMLGEKEEQEVKP